MNHEEIVKSVHRTQDEIRMNQLSVSLGEVVNMYLEGYLLLRPAYQRSLVWTTEHKDLLIESLLLRMPIPSMFVATTPCGRWEVVDGLQRLSTIINFTVGLSKQDREAFGNDYVPHFRIGDSLKYCPFMGGLAYGEWPLPLQVELKRTRLEFSVLDSLTTEEKKLELFRRVNQCGLKGS
jgi:Protein of unknown function DUF262